MSSGVLQEFIFCLLSDILGRYLKFVGNLFVSFGLGAGKWRVIRTVVLPNCVEGVITGCILSVGRIVGESAALLFTAGFAHALGSFIESLSSSGATLTVALYVYATEDGNFEVAFAIAAILMILTLLINLSATLIGKYFERESKV